MPYVNNKGADQPAHPRSLINTFFVCRLDSIIPLVSQSENSSLYLASVAAQAGFTLVANPKDRFSHDEAHIRQNQRIDLHILYEVNLCVTLIHYLKSDIPQSNSLQNVKQSHWTKKYRSLS